MPHSQCTFPTPWEQRRCRSSNVADWLERATDREAFLIAAECHREVADFLRDDSLRQLARQYENLAERTTIERQRTGWRFSITRLNINAMLVRLAHRCACVQNLNPGETFQDLVDDEMRLHQETAAKILKQNRAVA
ncbi:MAG: hypothetical protein ACFCD0_26955 [Gemmataceae bacterium]